MRGGEGERDSKGEGAREPQRGKGRGRGSPQREGGTPREGELMVPMYLYHIQVTSLQFFMFNKKNNMFLHAKTVCICLTGNAVFLLM